MADRELGSQFGRDRIHADVRKTAQWTNGDAFTADDVVFNLARWCESHVPNNSMATRMAPLIEKKGEEKFMGDVKKDDGTTVQEEQTREIFGARDGAIEKVDDFTVKLHLGQSRHHHRAELRRLSRADRAPRLRRDRRRSHRQTRSAPGPGSWSRARSACAAVYKRRTNGAWWGDTVDGMGPVFLDGVEYIDYGTDPSATIAAYEAEEIHTSYETPPSYVEIFDGLGLTKSEAVTANTICVRMNVKQPPFDNQQVRNAVQLAVDNATVLDLGYQGLGRLAQNHHVGEMHPEYFALPPIARDPEKAKALMAEAGQADTELELISLDDDFNRNSCDAVAAQMRDAGLKVKRTVLPGNTFWNNWTGYPFSSTEWNMRPLGVQVYNLAYRTGVPWNETAFANQEFDDLLTQAYAIADADQRRDLMGKMEKIIQDSGIIVQPYWRSTFRHMTQDVNGLVMHPTFEIHLERTWLAT